MRNTFLYLIMMLVAVSLLSGCVEGKPDMEEYQNIRESDECPETTRDPVISDSLPQVGQVGVGMELSINQTKENVKEFLYENHDKMEALAVELIRNQTDGQHLQYYPEENALYLYGETSYDPSEQLTEHTVLDAAAFMAGKTVFDLVSPSNGTYEVSAEHCEFLKAVKEENGELLCFVELIYCPLTFEQNEYASLEQVLPNWYIYLWYCE